MMLHARFFSHGEVSVLEEDRASGQVVLSVVLPACVMQAVTPQLLGAGLIDSYELRRPLAAWVPTVEDSGFSTDDPTVCSSVNAGLHAAARASLEAFTAASSSLRFPADALPVLPLGTYVRFRMRCSVDALAVAVGAMQRAAGVAELKHAFARVVAALLVHWGRAGVSPPPLPASAGRRSSRGGPGRGPPSSS
jgi:hypothetical protein